VVTIQSYLDFDTEHYRHSFLPQACIHQPQLDTEGLPSVASVADVEDHPYFVQLTPETILELNFTFGCSFRFPICVYLSLPTIIIKDDFIIAIFKVTAAAGIVVVKLISSPIITTIINKFTIAKYCVIIK
jgi:hypothetical protein